MVDADRQGSDVVKALAQVVGLVAGFVALVYVAGGAVLALRLYLEGLPSRSVVGQLPRDLLISAGLAQIVFPALTYAALYAAGRLLLGTMPAPKRLVRQWAAPSWRGWGELVAASAAPALVVTAFMWFKIDRPELGWNLAWLLPIAFLSTLLSVLVALNLRARLALRYGALPDPFGGEAAPAEADAKPSELLWNARRPIVSMTLTVGFAALPFCVIFAATINLLSARVCETDGHAIDGLLIGETGDRTYIGQKKKKHGPRLVFSIPLSHIQETFIGGRSRRRPCPK